LLIALLLGLLPAAWLGAQENGSPESQQDAIDLTPPRLSFVDGQVSFLRPGDQDWTQALVNMALSPGDQLFTGSPGNLEIQIGARAFVRGWANTQIGLENLESDYLQFKITAGHAAFDLRSLEPGRTLEVDTPNAAFTIDRAGYYRVNATGERTAFITRRGGRAVVILADGTSFGVSPSEEVVIEGAERPTVSSYSAPPLDPWDNWNYARTDRLLDAESARYVPPGVFGTADLDQYGRWRVVTGYGPVWVPTGVPAGWVPYSTGSWVRDPYYGWTWVDTAPWGWAPYHYGRWVYVDRYWCWAPGPIVARPIYSPALVAFYGGPHGRMAFGTTGPVVGWVALGWGEPCVPWWGRPGFMHRPWWGGWGGPCLVNNRVVHRTTVVRVEEIHHYRNAHVHNAIVAVPEGRFHRGGFTKERFARMDAKDLQPMHTAPQARETPAGFVPTAKHGLRPPERDIRRPVVATRPPHASAEPAERRERRQDVKVSSSPDPHIVQRPQLHENSAELPRPPFGQSAIERRPETGRAQQPAPPKNEGLRRPDRYPASRPPVVHRQPPQPQPPQRPEQGLSRTPAPSAPAATRIKSFPLPARQLPGEPASRLAPSRFDAGAPQRLEHGDKAPQRFEQRKPAADGQRSTSAPAHPKQAPRPGERPAAFPRSPGRI
jgi:hypothetical protein